MSIAVHESCGCDSRPRALSEGDIVLGIYEKAMPDITDWDEFFAEVKEGGFSFTDLSVDESAERKARLDWPLLERRAVRDAAARYGVQIGGICLSVHRAVGPGSADESVRQEASEIFRKGIELCRDLGAPVLQVAGYFAYYEEATEGQRERYIEALREAVGFAARAGVMLGIENVDGNDITSISKAVEICQEINSPWLQIYPDIGNIAEQQLDTESELRAGEGRIVAMHIKDVRVGEPRRVPLGEGIADFPTAFAELKRQGWSGRLMIEMWNDNAPDSASVSAAAREKVEGWLKEAGLSIAKIK